MDGEFISKSNIIISLPPDQKTRISPKKFSDTVQYKATRDFESEDPAYLKILKNYFIYDIHIAAADLFKNILDDKTGLVDLFSIKLARDPDDLSKEKHVTTAEDLLNIFNLRIKIINARNLDR